MSIVIVLIVIVAVVVLSVSLVLVSVFDMLVCFNTVHGVLLLLLLLLLLWWWWWWWWWWLLLLVLFLLTSSSFLFHPMDTNVTKHTCHVHVEIHMSVSCAAHIPFYTSKHLLCIYIYTWNPNDLYFWRSTPQNKAFSNQNKGHLGSRYVYKCIHLCISTCVRLQVCL